MFSHSSYSFLDEWNYQIIVCRYAAVPLCRCLSVKAAVKQIQLNVLRVLPFIVSVPLELWGRHSGGVTLQCS